MTAPASFTVGLTLPPSANHLFVNLKQGGRAKSQVYKAWREEARYHVLTAWRACGKPEWPKNQPLALRIRLGLEGRHRDMSNCIKALEDVLVAELPVPDDRWNDRLLIERDETIAGFAEVEITPLNST